ncbi:YlxR family protein [Desulfovibrio litoralis]|uniref:YlxR domain-containing protein n=1 Tax=Desulfovibrio litoralis DSM 11393 TaxID=1121455 RepID=A0A1M7T1U4_9BACT|nr:YlxR family protein [Desulfovibrio litoralis]SHN64688.1 hypothetical protein SAMN02745728_01449 [Desulfovibrio litoralis DSM 11393]
MQYSENNSHNLQNIKPQAFCTSVDIENKDDKKHHVAMRTCIICRLCLEKNNLKRFVLLRSALEKGFTITDNTEIVGEFVFDQTKTLTGRGYYLCNNENCFKKLFHYKHKTKTQNKT